MKKSAPSRSTASPHSRAKGEIRLISGIWRGRKLPVLNAQGLRPTGDRIKETLFNWLAPYIVEARCLDAFAGSGSLGFEALSRQAKWVTFLELDRQVVAQLKQNLITLKASSHAQIRNEDSLALLRKNPKEVGETPFDLVFLDPPFHFQLAEQAATLLENQQWLAQGALIYVETEKDCAFHAPSTWQCLKEKTSGMVCYRLYQKE